jgi:hypothetical protein
MLPGIRIVPKRRGSKLDRMSRVDFSRMYTVEHNVKVYDFGNVHASHLGRLTQQWILVITDGGGPAATGRLARLGPGPSLGEGDDDVEGGEEEEDEEEEEEVDDGAGTRAAYHYQYSRQ